MGNYNFIQIKNGEFPFSKVRIKHFGIKGVPGSTFTLGGVGFQLGESGLLEMDNVDLTHTFEDDSLKDFVIDIIYNEEGQE